MSDNTGLESLETYRKKMTGIGETHVLCCPSLCIFCDFKYPASPVFWNMQRCEGKFSCVNRYYMASKSKNLCNCEQPPVVDYPVDNHPLWFNAIAVEALLHHSILGVFALPFFTVKLLLSRAVVIWWRFVHVILTLVVPIHDRVIQLQLHKHRRSKTINSA